MKKKISGIVALLATFCAATAIDAQSMFRGDAMHSGTYAGPGPRQFHRVKWKFPTGDRVISSPVFKDNVIYFGGDDGNVYAVDAAPVVKFGSERRTDRYPLRRRSLTAPFISAVTTESFTHSTRRPAR
jgi:hypothetical protein